MIIDVMLLEKGRNFNIDIKQRINFNNNYNLYDRNVDVELKGILSREEKNFILRGKIGVNFLFNCDRCLNKVKYDLIFNINEKFSNNKIDLDDKNLEIWYFEGEKIDLYECICTNIYLNIPMVVLCKEDCKGLCQVCGNNLNIFNCNCKDRFANLPFKDLQKFFIVNKED